MEGGLKAEVISWCCIDWPSFNNVIRLRLRKMQEALKDQATDRFSFPHSSQPTVPSHQALSVLL